jgi:periplasmic protein TonB
MPAPPPALSEETILRLLRRWMGAAVFVAAIHGGVAFAVVHWPTPPIQMGEPPAAVMVELAPVPMSPDTPPREVAVAPEQMDRSEQSTPSEQAEEPNEETEPVEETSDAEPQERPAEEEVETAQDTPELPEVEKAEAVLPAPAEKPPVEPEKIAEAPPPPPAKKPAQASKAAENVAQNAPETAAPKPTKSQRAKTNAAPSPGTSSARALSSWQGRVMAHLNRRKRYPRGGGRGRTFVLFVVDRSGHVRSSRLVRSSGNRALDSAAVALARRASPLPAPPADVKRGMSRIRLTVPIDYTRR